MTTNQFKIILTSRKKAQKFTYVNFLIKLKMGARGERKYCFRDEKNLDFVYFQYIKSFKFIINPSNIVCNFQIDKFLIG